MGFWDKHLPAAGGPPPHYPQQRPAAPPPPPPTGVPEQYAPEGAVQQGAPDDETLSAALQNEGYQPQKAIAHRTETGRCPACNSTNWFTGASVGQQVKPHCFSCGYPTVQTGSGMGALGGTQNAGPVKPAVQVNTPNPDPGGF